MLKISQTSPFAPQFRVVLLALAIALPGSCASPTASPQTATLSTLYSFNDLSDGGFPEAGLALGSGGSLFGTTSTGGSGWGSVFELTPSQGGGWTETTLYTFTGGADGGNPVAGLVIASNNVMYGTTYGGGSHGYGTIFQISPGTGGSWTQKVLYSFANGSDGAYPSAGLALSSSGVLYGTTYGGGSAGLGTVFQLAQTHSGWAEKVLYAFLGAADGANPITPVIIGSSGQLLGATSQGGSGTNSNGAYSNQGTIFQLTPKGGGVWTEGLLYTFTGGSDGGSPESALIPGSNGVLYGSTFWGGTPTACSVGEYPLGCGVVYELLPPVGSATTWTETVLHTFTGVSPDGAHPYGGMGLNVSGALFGTTFSGGANLDVCFPEAYSGCGTIFSLKPKTGGTWTKSNITVFPGSPGGGSPNGLLLTTGGLMYGTTIVGGNTGGYGTVFLMN
jgi:uncharacterized repeat protein (TIGR03803 family)